MASRIVTQVLRSEPKAPSNMPWYTATGFRWVTAKMNRPLSSRASTTARRRMHQAFQVGMLSRLTIRTAGSCWVTGALIRRPPPS